MSVAKPIQPSTLEGYVHDVCQQTFRPKKKFAHGTIRYSLHKQACASLNSGINLRAAVKLPQGEDLNDWIAVHGTTVITKTKIWR